MSCAGNAPCPRVRPLQGGLSAVKPARSFYRHVVRSKRGRDRQENVRITSRASERDEAAEVAGNRHEPENRETGNEPQEHLSFRRFHLSPAVGVPRARRQERAKDKHRQERKGEKRTHAGDRPFPFDELAPRDVQSLSQRRWWA